MIHITLIMSDDRTVLERESEMSQNDEIMSRFFFLHILRLFIKHAVHVFDSKLHCTNTLYKFIKVLEISKPHSLGPWLCMLFDSDSNFEAFSGPRDLLLSRVAGIEMLRNGAGSQ